MSLLDHVHPDDRDLKCSNCSYEGQPDLYARSNGNILASCPLCMKYIKFVKQISSPLIVDDRSQEELDRAVFEDQYE